MILLKYQNTKSFLQKVTLQIGLEKFFWLKKCKSAVPWTCVIDDLNGKEVVGTFYENELQKANQLQLRIEKLIKRKDDKWNGKDTIIRLIVGLIKKTWVNEWVNVFWNQNL